jgi:hypothetical protein
MLRFRCGSLLQRVGSNPFRPVTANRLTFLVRVRPADQGLVQPALQRGVDSAPDPWCRDPVGRLEGAVLKALRLLLLSTLILCALGVQHIAYVRQKHRLCRQLEQKERELRATAQAFRSLQAAIAAGSTGESCTAQSRPVIAKRDPRKPPARG